MDLTGRIAAVLGPALIVVTTSEAINLQIWDNVHPAVVYLNGLFLLVGGLVIVTSHNRWQPGGEILVTLSGWLLLAAGTFRMFFATAPQLDQSAVTYVVVLCLGLLGIALCLLAFGKRSG
ncbi:MAG: hypothetical protein AAFR75_05705 [Pseudomonadota bacterium]